MQRWDASIRFKPRTEQEAGLLALRISVGGFAGFLAHAWAAGQRTLVEASLAALVNNAFTVEPAVEAQSAAQEQQASPPFLPLSNEQPSQLCSKCVPFLAPTLTDCAGLKGS